jgi:hypothetical protein
LVILNPTTFVQITSHLSIHQVDGINNYATRNKSLGEKKLELFDTIGGTNKVKAKTSF